MQPLNNWGLMETQQQIQDSGARGTYNPLNSKLIKFWKGPTLI